MMLVSTLSLKKKKELNNNIYNFRLEQQNNNVPVFFIFKSHTFAIIYHMLSNHMINDFIQINLADDVKIVLQ